MKLTKAFWGVGIVAMLVSATFDGPFSWVLYTLGFAIALWCAQDDSWHLFEKKK